MWLWCVSLAIILGSWWIWSHRRYAKMLDGWSRKTVFITGCDSGFGRQLALTLDSLGVPTFAGCYTENGIKELGEMSSDRLKTVHLDVSSTESITKAFEFVKDNIPVGAELWGVVNNAGLLKSAGPLEFMTRRRFEEIFQVNTFGMAEVCRIFLPLLRKSRGRIVNVTSTNGLVAAPCLIPYSASKYASEGLTGSIRCELHLYGVSVHAIEPSGFLTGIMAQCTGDVFNNWQQLPQPTKDLYGKQYLEKVTVGVEKGLKKRMSTDLSPVVDADIHALFAKHPRAHYLVGRGAKIIFLTCYFLPPFITDPVMRRVMRGFLPNHLSVWKRK